MPDNDSSPEKTFYGRVLGRLLKSGRVGLEGKVLVICGGSFDQEVLAALGFSDVTVTNIDDGMARAQEDAENLCYPDNAFDLVVVHSGLHHCRSPHRALLEMYRVSRRGVLAVEARDSLLMRCAARVLRGMDYEVTAVMRHGWTAGGVGGSGIPNYVYRWSEREVRKTIASYAPEVRHEIRFFYGLDVPYDILRTIAGGAAVWAVRLMRPLLALATLVFRRQGNRFAFYIRKASYSNDLQPWLTADDDGRPTLDRDWVERHFGS